MKEYIRNCARKLVNALSNHCMAMYVYRDSTVKMIYEICLYALEMNNTIHGCDRRTPADGKHRAYA